MLKRDFLASKGFNTGRGRPSKAVMDALAAYRAEHGAFGDDPATVTISAKSGGSTAPVVVSTDKVNVDAKAVRVWAKANNIVVGERGRIAPDIIAKYLADGGKTVSADEVKASSGGKDLRAGTPETSPRGSHWINKQLKYKVGSATVCGNCQVSLAYHYCQAPVVVSPDGNGFVPMVLVRG